MARMTHAPNIVAIWKPKGPTSHDIVAEIRRMILRHGSRQTVKLRVGHAGTLDPLAEGVLVVGIGREATQQLTAIVQNEKEYVAEIRLGMTSTTDDEEGTKTTISVLEKPKRTDISALLEHFIGTISQVPPAYSAVKVRGRTAYSRARRGEAITLEPRSVTVKKISLVAYRWPVAELRIVTGPGVYIRALARDIGQKLGTGGYLASLTRTRVGQFTREQSLSLAELKKRYSL